MPESLTVLFDQNIPSAVASWLRSARPSWTVFHVSEVNLKGKEDSEIFEWAQTKKAIIVTYDEHFADQRFFPVGKSYGIIRLKVWPTTIEETKKALKRLIAEVSEKELHNALVIIDRTHIRVRSQF